MRATWLWRKYYLKVEQAGSLIATGFALLDTLAPSVGYLHRRRT